jgi:hypothetical protein
MGDPLIAGPVVVWSVKIIMIGSGVKDGVMPDAVRLVDVHIEHYGFLAHMYAGSLC